MKVKEVIEKCSSENIWSLCEFEEEFSELKLVASNLNVDRYRWYEISTNVYECEDGFVGVSGVSQLYSEMMSYSDCMCECTAVEYESFTTVSYKPKNV
jgi:hypothetical protein